MVTENDLIGYDKETYYKVTTKSRQSVMAHSMPSAIVQTYSVGEIVTPVPPSKLFVFDDRHIVNRWLGVSGRRLFEVRCKNPKEIKGIIHPTMLIGTYETSRFSRFWSNVPMFVERRYYHPSPCGTLVCDELYVVSEITE